MKRRGTKYDRRLLPIAVIFVLLGLGNAIDYFFPSEKNFKKIEGVISNIDIESFYGKTRRTRSILYTKFQVWLNHNAKRYFIIERNGLDTGLANLRTGDAVELRVKRWHQAISYPLIEGNLFLARKDGAVVYDILYKCRYSNKIFMIIFAAVGLFFFVIYLDIVHNISPEVWFQRKVLMNRNYRR